MQNRVALSLLLLGLAFCPTAGSGPDRVTGGGGESDSTRFRVTGGLIAIDQPAIATSNRFAINPLIPSGPPVIGDPIFADGFETSP